jgi:type IV pilus assembly protein PilC
VLTFKYEARNAKTGQKIKAEVQADSEQAAAKLITEQGLTPLSIALQKNSTGGRFGRVKAKDRILFSRQLATLINAGLPLVQSLRSVTDQTTNKSLKVIANEIIADVEAGSAFSVALGKHPKVFNKVYISLIAAGEVSGTLDKGLERLADQQEKDADILSKVRGAMIYPAIVLMVMLAVVLFMIIKVLPQVQGIYSGIKGAKLPFITVFLLDISHFVTDYYYIVIIVVVVGGVLGGRWARTSSGKAFSDKLKMKAWPVGPLFMKMYMARFARTGTTLIASGVPLIQMLEITSDAVNNVHISHSIRGAIEKVKGGGSLADAITNDSNFLELVPNMLRIGEQSGAMESMLEKVADYFEKEVDNQIKAISTIIEPVLMVVMGIIALIIVAAILLPIYGLVNQSGFTNAG